MTMERRVCASLCFPICFDDRISKHPHPLGEKAPLFGEVERGVDCKAKTTIESTFSLVIGPNECKEG